MKFLLVAVALFGMARAALGDTLTSISPPLLPTVKCIYSVLKSSTDVKSVDVYRIDDYRLGFEYAFKGKDGQTAVSYIELVGLSSSAFLGDKISSEISQHAIMEGIDLTSELQLSQKCRLQEPSIIFFLNPRPGLSGVA